MNERMSWEKIQEMFPDQWVGLVDVEWDGATVVSAVVRYTDRTRGELTRMQLRDDNLYTCYTHPDHLAPLGIVGYMA